MPLFKSNPSVNIILERISGNILHHGINRTVNFQEIEHLGKIWILQVFQKVYLHTGFRHIPRDVLQLFQDDMLLEITVIPQINDTTAAFSSDIQQVNITGSINYAINKSTAMNLFKEVGTDYFNKLVYPRMLEITKGVFSKYTAENLVANRQTLSESIPSLYNGMAKIGLVP